MTRIALFCMLAATAATQCPYNSTTTSSTSTADNNTIEASFIDVGGRTVPIFKPCNKVKTISRPLSVIFQQQPIFVYMIARSPRFTQADSICYTFFPVEDNTETFKVYQSTVYFDTSTYIETFISKSYAEGANLWTSPLRGFVNYNIGYAGCGAYARLSCPSYGQLTPSQFILVFGPGIGPIGNGNGKLTDECVENARKLAEENSLELGDVVLLPYNLPVQCVFQQVCLPQENPLGAKQGGFCKAYNSSSSSN